MRIVFFGSGEFGLPTLAALARGHEVTGVVSQPDRPAGRGGALTPTPIATWAKVNLPGVPLVRSERVSAGEDLARVRALPADAWVVIAFGQKLSAGLLEGKRAVNLHASLLPRWRGAAPINAAVMAGDAETGNSVITLAERMDAGLVLAQSRRAIEPSVTAGELHDLLSADGPALVLGVLADLGGAIARGAVQDESRATRAPKLSRADAWVDWGRPAREVRARIHGLTPWPGVSVTIGGAGGVGAAGGGAGGER
ncbi:MAG: methionyl-tRNA formyltransferase, partial [Phycisphaerae bacterium]|nr:methionyl-tRNA formyltransferase [Phycisphaerae bacterium]